MSDPTPLQIIFWVVLLVLLVVGFGSFLVVRSWQDQTRAELKELLSRLRFFKNESKTIRLVIQDYAGHERPPYGQRVSALAKQMEALDRKVQALQTGYAQVQESVHARPAQRIDATLRAPLRWYHLRQQMLELQGQHDEIERALGEAMGGLEQLHRQSWEVAQQARQFQAGLQSRPRPAPAAGLGLAGRWVRCGRRAADLAANRPRKHPGRLPDRCPKRRSWLSRTARRWSACTSCSMNASPSWTA